MQIIFQQGKNMKNLYTLVLTALLTLSFSGCGSSEKPLTKEELKTTTTQTGTVTYVFDGTLQTLHTYKYETKTRGTRYGAEARLDQNDLKISISALKDPEGNKQAWNTIGFSFVFPNAVITTGTFESKDKRITFSVDAKAYQTVDDYETVVTEATENGNTIHLKGTTTANYRVISADGRSHLEPFIINFEVDVHE